MTLWKCALQTGHVMIFVKVQTAVQHGQSSASISIAKIQDLTTFKLSDLKLGVVAWLLKHFTILTILGNIWQSTLIPCLSSTLFTTFIESSESGLWLTLSFCTVDLIRDLLHFWNSVKATCLWRYTIRRSPEPATSPSEFYTVELPFLATRPQTEQLKKLPNNKFRRVWRGV